MIVDTGGGEPPIHGWTGAIERTLRMILCGDITLDAEFLAWRVGLCHTYFAASEEGVHVRAERFKAEGHFRGQRSLAGEKIH